jgi:spore coat protein CotH
MEGRTTAMVDQISWTISKRPFTSREFRDPTRGYSAFVDVDSFIDFHWLVELAKNADGYWFSQYMHKDRDGKLTMEPIWDWDRTFGNPDFPEQSTMG